MSEKQWTETHSHSPLSQNRNGHAKRRYCVMMTGPHLLSNNRNTDIPWIQSCHIHHIYRVWSYQIMPLSDNMKKSLCGWWFPNINGLQSSACKLSVLTWKTGTLQPSASYQKDGNSVQTTVDSALRCNTAASITFRLIFQVSSNHLWTTLIHWL